MSKKQKKKIKTTFYRLNQWIQADEIRVIDEAGKQIGVMSSGEAYQLARDKGKDLVEIAPKAVPPVCKIIDFKKFKFLEAKKQQKEKRKAKKVELKEIRFRPFIAENDFNFRIERAEEFLADGDRVRLVVLFRGREMAKKQFGYDLLKKAIEKIGPLGRVEVEPRLVGRRLEVALSPANKQAEKVEEKAKNNHEKTKDQKID